MHVGSVTIKQAEFLLLKQADGILLNIRIAIGTTCPCTRLREDLRVQSQ